MSGLRRPIRSDSQPEKTFEIDAVASAMPSITPTIVTLTPSVTVRNKGRSAWIVSDDRSMNRLTKPSAQTVRGIAGRLVATRQPPLRAAKVAATRALQREGELMKTRAAIAVAPNRPLEIHEVELDGPKAGEVLVEIMATGVCHTDAYTLEGKDSEGIFPSILGHEGAGIVREVGPGVTSVAVGDHVIPLYIAECRQCPSCLSRKTNLCTAVRATQGKGVMPDGTSRFSLNGETIAHYMGCSTFSNFTVLPEIALARVRKDAPFEKICYIGCGVTTGIGAAIWTAGVEPGSRVAVFGLGGIGLNVIQGARLAGAAQIVGVDVNPAKRAMAER